jgi:hypothetical protein
MCHRYLMALRFRSEKDMQVEESGAKPPVAKGKNPKTCSGATLFRDVSNGEVYR